MRRRRIPAGSAIRDDFRSILSRQHTPLGVIDEIIRSKTADSK